jgi:RNA polymerase sigma-70 factor, ECF subfamily
MMHSSVAPLPVDPEEDARAALERGDSRRAITILMQAYGRAIHRHCQQILGDRDLADDVHQVVFVEAFRDLARFEARSSFRTWLFGIARHRCLDAIKVGARRRRRFVRAESLPEALDERAAADDALAAGAEQQALTDALVRLPDEVRIAVLLRHVEGMSYDEIGEVCNARPATVQARVARALPRLRASLAVALALVVLVLIVAIAGLVGRERSSEVMAYQVELVSFEREVERRLAELNALIEDQNELIDQLRDARDEASDARVRAALAYKQAEIRAKNEALKDLKKARSRGAASKRDGNVVPSRRGIAVKCDPNDPLCGI